MSISEAESLLGDSVDGVVDFKGRPVYRATTGGWRSAAFIIGVEMAERLAYYGILNNLISYLTGPLHQSTAAAAANVNVLSGTGAMLPLLGAFVADCYLGRYKTILFSSILYILGLILLTLSVTIPSLRPPDCKLLSFSTSCPSPTGFQIFFFFMSLYIVTLAQGGHKPCVQAFGADQFDPHDPIESKSKSSFFNWWYFGMNGSILISTCFLTYIQENLSWGLGFGIPCISLIFALVIFLLGTRTYRYCVKTEDNPFMSIIKVYVAAACNRQGSSLVDMKSIHPISHEASDVLQCQSSTPFKASTSENSDHVKNVLGACNVSQVGDAKLVLQLVPIWATCLIYAVVFAQPPTLFTKQGSTMEREIGFGFRVPAAALQAFVCISIMTIIPIYDRILLPVTRAFTGLSSGITLLQRIGIGLFLSTITVVVAALVEAERLAVARDFGLIDKPAEVVPMSVWWLIPQYVIFGAANVFTMVGLQEFFYDQVPDSMRSMGLSLYLSIFGLGGFISGFLISIIEKVTSREGGYGWFSNNLNRAHLDYFYWLLAGLNTIGLGMYLYFARSYAYKDKMKIASLM